MKNDPEMKHDQEKFAQGLWLSLVLHAALGAALLFVPGWFPAYGDVIWGSETAGGGGITVGIVSNMSGISLPAPSVVTEDAIANDSAGFYEPEPVPEAAEPEPEPEAAEPVPEIAAPIEEDEPPPAPAPPPPPRPEPAADPAPRPENAVPFGEGGQPDINYGNASGRDGVGLEGGGGAFGRQYGAYVEAITRRIAQEWLRSMVDATVRTAPRVYVRFDILRDGTIQNIQVERPSGIPSLDNSARRAVFAASPLNPLPDSYRGSRVSVQFWFEYTR